MEKQIEEMLGELKEFMKYNPTEIYRMAEVLDFGPQEAVSYTHLTLPTNCT